MKIGDKVFLTNSKLVYPCYRYPYLFKSLGFKFDHDNTIINSEHPAINPFTIFNIKVLDNVTFLAIVDEENPLFEFLVDSNAVTPIDVDNQIGDVVKIKNIGFVYQTSTHHFKTLGFKNKKINQILDVNGINDSEFEIFGKVDLHTNSVYNPLYAVRSKTNPTYELLLGFKGLKRMKKETEQTQLIKFSYKFGFLSPEGYRHFPVFYFGYGSNGFGITILGLTMTVKFK